MSRLRVIFRAAGALLLMTLAAVLMLAISVVTLFHARRFCAEVVGRSLGQVLLRLYGLKLVVHQDRSFPTSQTIYVANHTSTLDLFILIALGLPNTRFFMKRKYLLLPPLGIISWLLGTFFTPPQSMPEKRVRSFEAAERRLRRSGESAFLSPEGTRVTSGEIGPFNKGAFHLATVLRAPIVPLFIEIPPDSNPGKGFDARPGTIEVTVHTPISTEGWRLEDLEANKNAVREHFVGYLAAAAARGTRTESLVASA